MLANELTHHSDSGKICAKCGDALIAPEWSQYVDEQHIFNLWSCTKCSSSFSEVSAFLPSAAKSTDDSKNQDVVPPRLVA